MGIPTVKTVALSPIFVSLILAIFIGYFLPITHSKYQISKVQQEQLQEGSRLYFEDLDGDGSRERIVALDNRLGLSSFIVYNTNKTLVDQWNFDSRYPDQGPGLFFTDLDQNGFKEVWAFTTQGDSVLINGIEPLNKNGFKQLDVFLDSIGSYNGMSDLNEISDPWVTKHSADSTRSLVFTLNAGYSQYPRNTYAYNPFSGVIRRSPFLTNTSGVYGFSDIDEDSKKEILIRTISAANSIDSSLSQKSDYKVYLTILNEDLEFYLPQMELPGPYSAVYGIYSDDSNFIIGYKSKIDSIPSALLKMNSEGKIVARRTIPFPSNYMFYVPEDQEYYINTIGGSTIQGFDSDLNLRNTFTLLEGDEIINAHLLSERRWVIISNRFDRLTIYDSEFENPVSYTIETDNTSNIYFNILDQTSSELLLGIQKGDQLFTLGYAFNPLYYTKYTIYIGLYALVFIIVWGIMRIQSYKDRKKAALQREITSLQIKALKNQFDPHFVFNIMNNLSEMNLTGNELEADKLLCNLTDFMRHTLRSSDEITHTLEDELHYVKNYLDLIARGMDREIQYDFKMDLGLDKKIHVPKNMLFTYVENAIKHGAPPTGVLRIRIEGIVDSGFIQMIVSDNGGGYQTIQTNDMKTSGRGIKIMQDVFDLHKSLNNIEVQVEVQTVEFPESEKEYGTRVTLTFSKRKAHLLINE
ncbi:sensor histidine kinase [Robiginitalea sp. SC105]|uniref:sensor histidine kinase n=1 Tax=Robiginitalea sp. SC105 TaxID=2762332 RepID=UPI00163A20A3|nr:histidine kinase [Robiginitalea sp. SC105]MBC2840111.1 histidine kinase [Robiginitalea sp. SC105]